VDIRVGFARRGGYLLFNLQGGLKLFKLENEYYDKYRKKEKNNRLYSFKLENEYYDKFMMVEELLL